MTTDFPPFPSGPECCPVSLAILALAAIGAWAIIRTVSDAIS